MNFKKNYKGMLLCLIIAIPCWFLGKKFPIVGGPVFGIILGMIITLFIKDKNELQSGITFTSKKILQYAVILLGFGMNLSVVLQTGKQSLPIILATISTSLIVAYLLHKIMHIPSKISTLIGVGSSICGGSAIAATAPVIEASDEEVAQSISVIFLFNMIAALLDNYIYQHRDEGFAMKEILWKRVLDINDRNLRYVVTGLGAKTNGVTMESGFDITPASEIMAILCLSKDEHDLRRRIENI